jgi:hypothetical protein
LNGKLIIFVRNRSFGGSLSHFHFFCTFVPGEMAEWSIAAVLKTVEVQASGGSNPSLSANHSICPATAGHFLFQSLCHACDGETIEIKKADAKHQPME